MPGARIESFPLEVVLGLGSLGLALSMGCASQAPGIDETLFLQSGVSVNDETAAVRDGLLNAGYRLSARQEHPGAVVMLFERVTEDGVVALVRAVTERGIALAYPFDGRAALGLRLLPATSAPPGASFVLARSPPGAEHPCLVPFLVLADGRVRSMLGAASTQAGAHGNGDREGCVAELSTEASGTTAEYRVQLLDFARLSAPTVDVPLSLGPEGLVPLIGDALEQHCTDAHAALSSVLMAARASLDLEESYRLSVSLAATAGVCGKSAEEQVQVFEEAMAGLVLTQELHEHILAVRLRLLEGVDWIHSQPDSPEVRAEERTP